MDPIRVAGVDELRKEEKAAEFHLFMEAILPRAQQFIDEKLQLRTSIRKWAAACIVALIGSVVLQVMKPWSNDQRPFFSILFNGLILLILVAVIIAYLRYRRYQEVRIEAGLERIGQFPLNTAIHRTELGTVLVDEDELLDVVEFNYQQLKDFGEAKDAYKHYIEVTSSLPVILSSVHKKQEIQSEEKEGLQKALVFEDEEKVSSAHAKIREVYQSISETSVKQCLIKKDSPFAEYCRQHDFEYDGTSLQPSEETSKTLEKVMGIVETHSREDDVVDIDIWSDEINRKITEDAIKLSHLRDNILTKVVGNIFPRLSDIQNYPAYEFYCPTCHKDQLIALLEEDFNAFTEERIEDVTWDDNARVQLVDWENGVWRCKTCERETHHPVPVHKLYKQVIYPAYDSLLLENEKERLKIYSELKDKKIRYKQEAEREIDEINRENRRDLDEQVFKLNALESQVRSTKRTIDTMQHLMITMEAVSREKIAAIEQYADKIQRQILEENQQIERTIQREVEQNIQQANRAMTVLAQQAQKERQEQMKVFVAIAKGQERQEELLRESTKHAKRSAAVAGIDAKKKGYSKRKFLGLGKSELEKEEDRL